MAFTIEDLGDLLNLLRQHPDWKEAVRREVLSEELLGMPALMRQIGERVEGLAAAQGRTEARLEELAARVEQLVVAQTRTEARLDALAGLVEQLLVAQARTDAQLGQLVVAQARTDAQLGQLVVAQARTDAQLGELTRAVAPLVDRVGQLRGAYLEIRYRNNAHGYFGDVLKRLRVVDANALADSLEDAVAQGRIDGRGRRQILLADLVLQGRRPLDDVEMYVVVEVSGVIDSHDVERAVERAALLEVLGRPVLPAVAGEEISSEAERVAKQGGVLIVLDGRTDASSG